MLTTFRGPSLSTMQEAGIRRNMETMPDMPVESMISVLLAPSIARYRMMTAELSGRTSAKQPNHVEA